MGPIQLSQRERTVSLAKIHRIVQWHFEPVGLNQLNGDLGMNQLMEPDAHTGVDHMADLDRLVQSSHETLIGQVTAAAVG